MKSESLIDLDSSKWTPRLLALALLLSLALTFWSQAPYLWDRYSVVGDVRNFYWFARYWDSELFPVDYRYLSSGDVIVVNVLGFPLMLYPPSLGYALLFYPATLVLDYIWVSKFLVFALMPLCILYLFRLGKLLGHNRAALSLCVLFIFFILASPQSTSIVSGLQRGFAIPILIVFLYYMAAEKYLRAALMVLVSVLFYAPNFPLVMLTYVFSMVRIERPFRLSLDLSRRRLVPFILVLVVSLMLVGLMQASRMGLLAELAPSSAPLPTTGVETLSNMTEEGIPLSQAQRYQAEGSTSLFDVFPWFGRAGVFDIGADVVNFFILLVFGGVIYLVVGPQSLRRLPGAFWCLLAAGIILYLVSFFAIMQLSTLALYLPSRYTRSTLIVIALCYVGANWVDFLNRAVGWFHRNVRLVIFFIVSLCLALGGAYVFFPVHFHWLTAWLLVGLVLKGILALIGIGVLMWGLWKPRVRILGNDTSWKRAVRVAAFLVVGIAATISGVEYIRVLETKPISSSRAARDVYKFVATLSKDVILAGESEVITGIPAFSRKSVLFRQLFPRKAAPIVEFFDAQYAESPDVVLDFCERYGVDYLVIDAGVFDPDYLAKASFFYQPYNDEIVKLVAGRSDFVLLDVEPVFASGSLSVIECDAETLLAGD